MMFSPQLGFSLARTKIALRVLNQVEVLGVLRPDLDSAKVLVELRKQASASQHPSIVFINEWVDLAKEGEPLPWE